MTLGMLQHMSSLHKVKTVLYCALLCISFGVPTRAGASVIRIVPSFEATFKEALNEVTIIISVTNEGDEQAEQVTVEFPTASKTKLISTKLPPQDQQFTAITFPAAQIKIGRPGNYILPYRILYTDRNLFPYSAPHVGRLTVLQNPGQPLGILLDGVANNLLVLKDKTEKQITAHLTNTSKFTTQITALTTFSTYEIQATPNIQEMPFVLNPGEEVSLTLTAQNLSGNITSSYPLFILVEGMIHNQHFAITQHLTIAIGVSFLKPLPVLILCLFGGAILFCVYRGVLKRGGKCVEHV